MTSQTVQQFFADYFKTMLIKGSYVDFLDPSYLDTSDLKNWPYQHYDTLENNNLLQYDTATLNGIIMENNYLKYRLRKTQTTKLCNVLDIQTSSTQSLNETVNTHCNISKDSSIGYGERSLQEDEIPKDFLHDFLYLMEATKHLPIRTQNIVILHFAAEHRERMNK
ncbi:uncharacterized protein LOC131667901 [Phymastichus coffea]|uniref:uncharacterized protein LOC131667901 n=1 Tax=Phymastichus coffea TaxID=108790 RepID=UPI00273BEF32|nr:uncharacterized protein LOC131667901 [Phymastichus coffea]